MSAGPQAPSSPHAEDELLQGWGRTTPARSEVLHVEQASEVVDAVRAAGRDGVIARGLGRSYGDPAQNAGGLVLDGPARSGLVDIDLHTGVATILAGTSLDDLMKWLIPLGWRCFACWCAPVRPACLPARLRQR